jgi:tRNA pseudouridine55 synthase
VTGPRIQRREIDGVLLFDKPLGWTSNRAVQVVKRLYRAERAGHTGTLDPLATGLLPICLGEATKFSAGLLDADKTYVADIRLGITTSTGDAEGEVLARHPVDADDDRIERAAASLRGEIDQIPPMHSALKRDGRPLYAYARAGIEVERKARRVSIHELTLLDRDGDCVRARVRCSKGTYIRVLAEDLGAALGCGGHLAALRRTSVGRLGVDHAVGPETLESRDEAGRDALLLPVDALVEDLPAARLTEEEAGRFVHGRSVSHAAAPGLVRAYDASGAFLGLAEADPRAGQLRPARLMRVRDAGILAKAPDSK